MALTTNNNQNTQVAEPKAQHEYVQPQRTEVKYTSLLNADRNSARLMERESVSASLSKYQLALEEVGREDDIMRQDANWRIIALDGSKSNLFISALIYTYEIEKTVIGFAMSVASTWRPSQDVRQVQIPTLPNQPPQQCDIPLVAGDVWNLNPRYRDVVISAIEANYPGRNVGIAGHFTIPAETSDQDKVTLRRIMFRAHEAVGSAFEKVGIRSASTASALITFQNVSPEEQLSIGAHVKQPDSVNTFGLPNREDIRIEVNVSSRRQKDNFLDERQQISISRLGGYLDIIDMGPNNQTQTFGQPLVNPNARFAPQFVITKIDSGLKFVTLETLLAGLGASYTLVEDSRWISAIRPDYGIEEDADTRNIGALTTLIADSTSSTGLMGKTATHTSDFNLFDFCHSLFKADQFSVAIDVEEAGEMTHITKLFVDAANGSAQAQKEIFDACNVLTGDRFGMHFQPGMNMFANVGMRIPLGYYKEAGSDKLQDLRNIDFLSLLNKTDLETVKRWNQSNNSMVDSTLRLDEKVRIINTYYQSNAKINNYAIRLYINPDFIVALARSMHECVEFQREGSAQALVQQTYGNQSFAQFGFGQQGFSLTQQGGGYAPGQNGIRWGNIAQQNFQNGFNFRR